MKWRTECQNVYFYETGVELSYRVTIVAQMSAPQLWYMGWDAGGGIDEPVQGYLAFP